MNLQFATFTAAMAVLSGSSVSGFTAPSRNAARTMTIDARLFMSIEDEEATKVESASGENAATALLSIPLSYDEMIRQSSAAMKDAYDKGITRQIIRVLLPRGKDNADLLVAIEEDVNVDTVRDAILVPPDETWQGGIMQLYRAASITCQDMLR
jgi:hypothetical protein